MAALLMITKGATTHKVITSSADIMVKTDRRGFGGMMEINSALRFPGQYQF